MSKVRLTPKARRDLEEIWTFSVDEWGAPRAERYMRRLQTVVERVCEHPETARPCDDIRPGYRRASAGAHVVFLRMKAGSAEIVRVLHARMDFPRRL
jgi:toxin ParE1/3/4